MNMHNFPLGPAKPGDGPSPDRDSSAKSRSGFPRAGAERSLGVATSSDRLASGGVSECRTAGSIPATGANPITAGPAALRDALFRCADAMADGFGRDWEREEIERRVRAWEQRQRHG